MNKKAAQFLLLSFVHAWIASSLTFGQSPETLDEFKVDGFTLNDLDLSRSAVLSGTEIESRQVSSISDLSGLSPSLYINSNGIQSYGDIITLRGVGNSQLFGDPGVALYVDGVPSGSTSTFSNTLFDVDAVEVLKGYHGHRFGKNTPGGILNITTRKAGDTHRSKLYASYESFNTQNYRVLADGPTGERSSYYFGLNRSESDGFADNRNPSGKDATSESWNGRLGFGFTTSDGLEIGIGGTWEEFDLGAQPVVHRNSASGFYQRNSEQNEIGAISSNSQHIKVSSKTGFGGIKSVTSHNQWKLDPNILDLNYADMGLAQLSAILDAVGNPISSTSRIEEKHDGWNEELSFFSEEDSSFPWSVMMIASTNEVTGKAERNYPMPTVAQTNPTYFNAGVMLPASSTTSYEIETESFALSTQISRKLSEGVSCEIGLRVDHVSRDLQRSKVNSLSPSPSDISANKDYTWLSPTISLRNDLNQNFAAFFKSSLTEKPGGFSPFVDSTGLIAAGVVSLEYKEEKIWGNEFGFSYEGDDQASGLSISFFWNEISDYQFEKPSGAFDYFVDNAEEVELRGFELDFYTKPFEDWVIKGAYGMVDGEIKKHAGLSYNPADDPFAPVNPILGPHDFSGKDVPFTPEQTLSLSLTNLVNENFSWTTGVTHIGKIHYLDQAATETVNDSYTLWNASIAYSLNDWDLNLYGTNLTDEEYYSSLVTSLTGAPGIVGAPRIIGLSISKEF